MYVWKYMESDKVDVYTRLAIQNYARLARAQRRVDELECIVNDSVIHIPEKDMQVYVNKTQEIDKEEDKRLTDFLRRRYKRR